MSKKNFLLYFGMLILSILGVALLVKFILIKNINNITNKTLYGLIPVVLLYVSILLINKLQYLSSLEWIKKILMRRDSYPILLLPMAPDFRARNYFSNFQIELGNDFNSPGIFGIMPVIAGAVYSILTINWFRVLLVEGIEYYTEEVASATLLMIVGYILLLNCRSLALGSVINACKDRSYMGSTWMYYKLPIVTTALWFVCFILPFIIRPLRVITSLPLVNICSIIVPILILPFITRLGCKKITLDILSGYDMDSTIQNMANRIDYSDGFRSSEYRNEYYNNQGYNNQDYDNQDYNNNNY